MGRGYISLLCRRPLELRKQWGRNSIDTVSLTPGTDQWCWTTQPLCSQQVVMCIVYLGAC
jgi:hypothetical protein